MPPKIKYLFTATIWQHAAPNGWCFVCVPQGMSAEIRYNLQWQEEGWGRLKATAQIGHSQWETAIWFDTKQHTYLLPLKAAIRKQEGLAVDMAVEVAIWV